MTKEDDQLIKDAIMACKMPKKQENIFLRSKSINIFCDTFQTSRREREVKK